jgi:hypothetical protein
MGTLRYAGHRYHQMIGTHVRLEYFDHNETFAQQLRRDGTALRRVTSRDGADEWFLIETR